MRPTIGPGLSAFIICIEPVPREGKIAIVSTKIPMPPIQCVKLRQKSTPCGRTSTAVKTEEPVVVRPEHDSKKLSIKDGKAPLM